MAHLIGRGKAAPSFLIDIGGRHFKSVLGQIELPLSYFYKEAALLHLTAPSVQPLHRVVLLPREPSVEERLGVDAPTRRLLELHTRRGLELREVLQYFTPRARHVRVRVIVLHVLVCRVKELVALAPIQAVVAVWRYVVSNVLADGDCRLRASNKLNLESANR